MSNKIKAELSKWISDEDRIVERRTVDAYGTEIVVTKTSDNRYSVLRGFSLGEGAGVSVDVSEGTIDQVLTNLLSHYKV